jgi:hypothetical protein
VPVDVCVSGSFEAGWETGGNTIAGLVEAVGGIAVACEDDHLVPALLQPHGRIYHQPLGAPDTQVGVQKDYRLCPFLVAGHGECGSSTMVGW